MKAIFKGNKFAIQWTIKDAVTSLPFDFTGMFVEYILYSDSYKGRIVGATTNINKMQAEIPANILPVGVYNIICKYRNSINEGQCIYRNAFQITRNPEFIECDNIVVIESFSAPLKLENMDINYLGHFTSSDLLIDCNQPSWALVGKLNEAEPWFFYTEDAIPAGSQYGWNNMSDILGKYNLLTSSKEVYHTTLFDRFTSYQQIEGASVTKEDTTEINNIIEAIKTNKSVSFYYNPSKTTFNYFGTLDCYFNETETEFGCYIPTEDGYVVARCNLSNPNQWSLVRGQSTGEGTSVTNYNQLKERPSINGVTLTGNHNPTELDLATVTQFNQVKDISNHALDVSNQSDRKSDSAVNTANQAYTKADEAINTAEEAKSTAELAKTAVRTLEGLANATEAQQVLAAQVVQIEENKQNIASNKAETDEEITELAQKKADSITELSFEEGIDIEDEEGNKIVEVKNNEVKVFGKKFIGKEDIPFRARTIVENLPDSDSISIEDNNGNEVIDITPDVIRLFGYNTLTRHVAKSIETEEILEDEIVIEDNDGNEIFAATPNSVRVMGKNLSGYSGSSSEGQRLPQLTIGTLKYGNYTSSGVVSSTTSLVSDTIGVPYVGAKLYISINDNYIVDVYSSFINGDYGTEYNSKIGTYYNQEVVLLPDYANSREVTYLRFVVRKKDNSSISNLKEHSLEVSYEDNYNVVDSNAQQLDHAQAMAYKFVAKNAKFNDKAVFIHGSDIHSDWLRAENLFKVADAINADGVIMTGDLMAHNYTDGISPLTNIIKKYKTNHYFCIGNHEVGYNYLGKQFALSDQEVYNKLIADNIGSDWVINGKTYYYSDITEKGIRIISVNQYIEGAENGTSLLRWALHYSQEEIDWIISTLASTPAGYGVLMINHTPEIISSAIDGNNEFYSDGYNNNNNPTSSVTGYILRDIVDAFIAKSSINKTYSQQGTPSSLAVSADFSTSQADFIGYCNGHYHGDAITKVTGAEQYQLQLNVMGTVSYYGGSAYPFQNETSDLARNSKNKNGDAFNVYVIDKTSKEVKVLRIGANYKWDGTERKFINIKYK